MSSPSSTLSADDRDELLARLLAELADKARRGEPADVEPMAAAYPDLAKELRELWAAAQFADEFARPPDAVRLTPRPQPMAASPQPEPRPANFTGRTFGDYELLEEIGRGGMGVVYRARETSLNRIVALKMILRGEHARAEDLARFAVEAQAAAHLEHPNIVPIYASGEHEGQAYFCMRYVEGETLAALLARGPLRPRDAAAVLAVISRAVHFAHQRGILHRDLKPANVLLVGQAASLSGGPGGQAGSLSYVPMITDFGLAKRVAGAEGMPVGAGLTHSGAILGTPAYMAPEQITVSRGKPSPASDVYSLGVILYEMLTGRPPFQAPTAVDTLLLVLEQDPVRPGMLNPKVDADLELICLKCIQKEPELRYAGAGDLARDLEAYLNGEELSVRRTRLTDVGQFFSRLLRETHHAVVLENWGLLWMAHSVMILSQCVLTTLLAWNGVRNPFVYLGLWGGGLMAWGVLFWKWRKRAGPVLFIERQVAHVWGAAILATISVFIAEMLLALPVLTLAPLLAVIAGMTFMVKAGMLSGAFYLSAAAEFAIAAPMALYPEYGLLLFGLVTAVCFFIPGLKYYRQRQRSLQSS
jgi:serine/threonine protein kinase